MMSPALRRLAEILARRALEELRRQREPIGEGAMSHTWSSGSHRMELHAASSGSLSDGFSNRPAKG